MPAPAAASLAAVSTPPAPTPPSFSIQAGNLVGVRSRLQVPVAGQSAADQCRRLLQLLHRPASLDFPFQSGGGRAQYPANAKHAEIWGTEFEATAIPFRGMEATAGYSFISPKYTEWTDLVIDPVSGKITGEESVADKRSFPTPHRIRSMPGSHTRRHPRPPAPLSRTSMCTGRT